MGRGMTAVKWAGLVALATAPWAPAWAGATATVVEYGVFSTDPVDGAPEGTPLGRYRLIERTRTIPLRVGVRFGFCARFDGLDGVEGKYTLTEIVRHPVMVNPAGIEVAGWNVPRMLRVEGGKGVWCGGHVFAQPHELVPGTWRFTVGDSDADLLVQEFDAVPAAGK